MKKTILFSLIGFALILLVAFVLYRGTASPSVTPASPAASSTLPTQTYSEGETFITYVDSDAGKIAVQVSLPEATRYEVGAPLLVHAPVFFTPKTEFEREFDAQSLGFATVSFLQPGWTDRQSAVSSEGENDFGGELSIAAFHDVLRFVLGAEPNSEGFYLKDLVELPLLQDNVGLYAFSHAGISSTNVLAYTGEDLDGIAYLVGRENPSVDMMYPLELGYFLENKPVLNPVYQYPEDYSSEGIELDYSTLAYDISLDVPYFDLNGNGRADQASDFVMGTQVPSMFGKRFYSEGLTHALLENGALTEATWPSDLATPEETATLWPYRESINNYDDVAEHFPDLHVMLVFGERDHVSSAVDKPNAHLAYDNYSSQDIWVRLNPDAAYVAALAPKLIQSYQDHPANTEPSNWMDIATWGYRSLPGSTVLVPLAAVAEMADRAQYAEWSPDLESVLHP